MGLETGEVVEDVEYLIGLNNLVASRSILKIHIFHLDLNFLLNLSMFTM